MNSAAYSPWDPGCLLGSIVDERWRLERSLAAIEGAAFYSGVEIESGRPVMLEVTAAIPVSRLRQLRRPELLGAISHPSVLEVLEVGATIEGLHYAVMERAEGEPLSTLLARQGRLAPEHAAKVAISLATALQGIHAAGSVHGQLHPARVFVGEHGRVQLSLGLHQPQVLDLSSDGTAQLIVSRHPAFDWNDVARAVVTPVPYCAPEQLLRHPLDARMDIYSLGALLYEMLHGTPPHACETVAGVAAARLAFPASPLADDVPAALRKEVERALAKAPSVRHPSARAFSIALEESMLSLVRGPTEVLATEAQRLGDWTLVRRIRETKAGTHWNTAEGFLLVDQRAELCDTRAAARMHAAEAFAGISHPGIARIVDSMGAGEISYVVLDAPKGVTLRELEEKMSVSTDILSRIALDALEAIECAHAHGAVFGDLDADSVLVTKRGEVVVLPTCRDGDTFRAEDDVVALGKLAQIEVPPHTLQLLAKRLRSTVSVADRELVGRFVTLADASVSPPSVATPLGTLPKPPPSPASVKSTLPPPPHRIYERAWHDLGVSETAISLNGALPAHLHDTERPVVSGPDIVDSRTRPAAKLGRAPVMAMATMCVACALVGYVLWPGASTVVPGAAPPAQRIEDRRAAPQRSRAPALLQPTAREAQVQSPPPAKHENVAAPAATSLLPKRAARARSDSTPSAPARTLRGDGDAHAPSVEADAINYRPTSL